MKTVTATLFILISTNLCAQQESRWKLGLEISEDKLSGENYVATSGIISGYTIEYTELNYSIGILFGFNLDEKATISSGLFFSNKNVSGGIICHTCNVIPALIKQQYLSVPVSVSYGILTSRLRPHLKLGFINNVSLINELENSNEYFSSNGYFIEGFAGMSLSYKLGTNWEAEIGYNYRTALTTMYKEASVGDYTRNKLTTNSLAIGMKYVIK
ncbi:MAG: porin family protein [Cytophagales bacterium]|nr:porin family protein [Cytophagales bacterium]